MRLKNIGTTAIASPELSLNPGETSGNLDDILARQLVADHRGSLAIAPESEHQPGELDHADEKKKPEEPVAEPAGKTKSSTMKPGPTKTGS